MRRMANCGPLDRRSVLLRRKIARGIELPLLSWRHFPPRTSLVGSWNMKLYERCANEIAEMIRSGMLRPGDRLPSVRAASAARGLSRSTVFEAYYSLEAR